MPPSKSIIAVAGGIAVLGLAGFFLVKRSRANVVEDDDDAFEATVVGKQEPTFTDKTKNKLNGVNGTTTTATKTETINAASNKSIGDKLTDITKVSDLLSADNRLLAEALNEMEMTELSESPTTKLTVSAKKSAYNDGGNKKQFPLLGLSVSLPRDWEIREEQSPVPNVAMLAVWNPSLVSDDAGQQQAQQLPMIVLSVEDIRGDNMNLAEFKNRTKDLAVNQMLMMTGGAIQPMVTKDCGVQEGPFRHTIEYAQVLPPFYEISVINLIEVRNGIAYTFQMTGLPTTISHYKSTFMEMARGISVEKISTSLGHVELHTGVVKAIIDSMWTWEYPGKHGALATFTTTSSCKKEEIFLYAKDAVPPSAYKKRNEKTVSGVEIVYAYDGNQQEKTFTYNGYTLVVKPLQKPISYLPEDDLISAVKSVTPSTVNSALKNGATFVNKEHGYQVDIAHGSRIVASRIGGGTIAYAPHGVSTNPVEENQPPSVTIRIGTPEDDPECVGSLDEWETRMRQEAMESDIKDIKRTVINNEPCLTFVTHNSEEIAPGQRIDVRGKIFVFVHKNKTTLVRWEVIGKQWRKYEDEMKAFVESFKFI